jgi:hypothetical protein
MDEANAKEDVLFMQRRESETSSHHQPEAQHPNSAIHKLPADYPHLLAQSGHGHGAQRCLLLG